ncbi:MAG: hypothetical protein HRU22_04990 [Gammaproteobacteria bacterium]|nr:hypothetical protein [Gammaproteobacteria bacterium]
MRLRLSTLALLLWSTGSNAQQSNYVTPVCPQLDDLAIYNDGQFNKFGPLVQGNDNWFFRQSEIAPQLELDEQALEMLSQISLLLKERGTTLIMTPIPHRSLIYPDKIPKAINFDFKKSRQQYVDYVRKIRQHNIHVVDFLPMVNTDLPNLFYQRDNHWLPEGERFGAKVISDYIVKLPVYSQIKKQQFESSSKGIYGFEMIEHSILSKLCDSVYPKEYHKIYQTVVVESESEDSLFGAEQAQDVVLLGTSFSTNPRGTRNFSGFLSEALSSNVVNHAISGGGLIASINQYIASDDFKQKPPKIIIWEFPIRSIRTKHLAQVLPLLNNASCTMNPLTETLTTLKIGTNLVAYNGGKNYQQLKQHQVLYEFKFDNPKVSEFVINTRYIERRQFKAKVGHQRNQDSNGHFLFDQGYNNSIKNLHFLALEIKVEDPKLVGTKVLTKVCTQESS